MYEKLLGEQFNAHDSLEDVVALGRVLHSNKLQQALEGMVALARQANNFCEDIAMKAVAKGRNSTLHRLGISDVKISKAGLDMNTLSSLYNAGGSRALLTILALPPSKTSSKPRVTKKLTVLTSLVNFFATR